MRYCLECKSFVSNEKFKPGCRRNICKQHLNERIYQAKMKKWALEPQIRQSYIVWQIAYLDSIKIFGCRLALRPSQLFEILQLSNIPPNDTVRIIPVDPSIPLSSQNFCITSKANRKEICHVWKQLRCKKIYEQFFDPQYKRPIYSCQPQVH